MSKYAKIKLNCLQCKNDFYRSPSVVHSKTNKGGGKYCSRVCKSNYLWASKGYKEHMSDIHKGKVSGSKGFKWNDVSRALVTGEKNYRWIEDRTQVSTRYKESLSLINYRDWRTKVFTRDNFKCKIQNTDCKGQLQAHHILNWKDYPELRFDINNGITLCLAHHPRGRVKEKQLSPYFMEMVSVSKE